MGFSQVTQIYAEVIDWGCWTKRNELQYYV